MFYLIFYFINVEITMSQQQQHPNDPMVSSPSRPPPKKKLRIYSISHKKIRPKRERSKSTPVLPLPSLQAPVITQDGSSPEEAAGRTTIALPEPRRVSFSPERSLLTVEATRKQHHLAMRRKHMAKEMKKETWKKYFRPSPTTVYR